MALIFLGALIVFYRFKFRVSPSQTAMTSSPMTSGSQFIQSKSTGLSGLGALLERGISLNSTAHCGRSLLIRRIAN